VSPCLDALGGDDLGDGAGDALHRVLERILLAHAREPGPPHQCSLSSSTRGPSALSSSTRGPDGDEASVNSVNHSNHSQRTLRQALDGGNKQGGSGNRAETPREALPRGCTAGTGTPQFRARRPAGCRAQGQQNIARHVIRCRFTQEMRV